MKLGGIRDIRIGWCLQVAIVGFLILPWLTALLPYGGDSEQAKLNTVICHLKRCRDVCEDPKMKNVMDYTIRRYSRISPFSVAVMQLREDTLALNNQFCPGITLDESVLRFNVPFAASILVHEALHDYPPFFGHSHIDQPYLEKLTCTN
jgi:hypothetical protein